MMPSFSENVRYLGVDDLTLDLFEGQYPIKDGVSYNSYLLLDEKVAVFDTVDARAGDAWLQNLQEALQGRSPDYLIVLHMEPDHAANLLRAAQAYPDMTIVGNAKTFVFAKQFFGEDFADRRLVVAEGDTLSLGSHKLTFVFAPMVHWPEVMVAYEETEKLLFSADAFGKFGALSVEQPWEDEARRYYLNIVGKYGTQVQKLLQKAATLDIRTICPLHGPVLTGDLTPYLSLYDTWSSYRPEEEGVLVAYASIYGHTAQAAQELAEMLTAKGQKAVVIDLARTDVAQAVALAFRYDRLVLASASYDGGMFPPMEAFVHHLRSKNFQQRRVGLVENGTWGPIAARAMSAELEKMRNITIASPVVTVRSALDDKSRDDLRALAENMVQA